MNPDQIIQIIREESSPVSVINTNLKFRNNLKQSPQAVLLDVYGTLFVSASGDIHSFQQNEGKNVKIQQLLERFNLEKEVSLLQDELEEAILRAQEEMRKKGVDFPEIRIEKIWAQIFDELSMDKIKEFALRYELIVNPVSPMPGLPEMLKWISKNGIQLGIISNAQFFTPYLFEAFLCKNIKDLGFNTRLLFYSFEFGYAKPSLFMFTEAINVLEDLAIQPEQVIYMGNDMRNDIYPAREVGFQTALFAGDLRSLRLRQDDPKLKKISPDLVITQLRELELGMPQG